MMVGASKGLIWPGHIVLAVTASIAGLTEAQNTTTIPPTTSYVNTYSVRAPFSSRLEAVLIPCLLAVVIAGSVVLALAVVRRRERRQTEAGFNSRRMEAPGGSTLPAGMECISIRTLAAHVERQLTSEGLTSDLLLSVSLSSVVLLLALIVTSAGLAVALNRRATRGAYSPSRQEKEGSRVEMWNITQPPPVERLI